MPMTQPSLIQLVGDEKARALLTKLGIDPNDGTNLHQGLGLLLDALVAHMCSSRDIDGGTFDDEN